jgi:hypothetical protein
MKNANRNKYTKLLILRISNVVEAKSACQKIEGKRYATPFGDINNLGFKIKGRKVANFS